jgi:phosphoglycolate phosphatase
LTDIKKVADLVKDLRVDPDIGAVVVAFDPYFNYRKMILAGTYLARPDVLFVATGRDSTYPFNNNEFVLPSECLTNFVKMVCVESVEFYHL